MAVQFQEAAILSKCNEVAEVVLVNSSHAFTEYPDADMNALGKRPCFDQNVTKSMYV